MNAKRKKELVAKYAELVNAGKSAEDIITLLAEDEGKYTKEEVEEVAAEYEAPKASKKDSTDPANTQYDEYRIKLESDGKKFTGATVMNFIAVRKIHPDTAKSLNAHAGNSLTCYFKKGTYKVSDKIDIKTLKSIAPGFAWSKSDEE